jgi:hypothetical protein
MPLDRRESPGALDVIDRIVGEPLSWLAGKPTPTPRRGLSDQALGELLSWTGLVPRSDRRRHRR